MAKKITGKTDLRTLALANAATAQTAAPLDTRLGAVETGKVNLTAIAPAYSASATYALGVYCTYGGATYRCTTAIETPEAWTAGHWTAETMGAAVAANATQLAAIMSCLTIENTEWSVE